MDTEVEVGHVISHTLEVASGSSGKVFFCDSSNFNEFGLGETYSSYEEHYLYSFGAITYSFEVPHTDTWYVVIHNVDLSENIQVTGSVYFEVCSQSATYTIRTTVTRPPPSPSPPSDMIFQIVGSTVVVAVDMVAFYISRRPKGVVQPTPDIY